MGMTLLLRIVWTSAKILELLWITNNHAESIHNWKNEVCKPQINLDGNINRSMKSNLIFKGIPYFAYSHTNNLFNTDKILKFEDNQIWTVENHLRVQIKFFTKRLQQSFV